MSLPDAATGSCFGSFSNETGWLLAIGLWMWDSCSCLNRRTIGDHNWESESDGHNKRRNRGC